MIKDKLMFIPRVLWILIGFPIYILLIGIKNKLSEFISDPMEDRGKYYHGDSVIYNGDPNSHNNGDIQ